jgi:hypothetical protein
MPTPFQQSAAVLDLSPRLFKTAAVVASPAAATETIIASLTINQDIQVSTGVLLFGWAAFTAGTSAVGGQLKIRRTDVSGATVKDSGAVTVVATKLYAPDIVAFDVFQAAPGAVYVLTLTMASGAAESTVSAVSLVALAV